MFISHRAQQTVEQLRDAAMPHLSDSEFVMHPTGLLVRRTITPSGAYVQASDEMLTITSTVPTIHSAETFCRAEIPLDCLGLAGIYVDRTGTEAYRLPQRNFPAIGQELLKQLVG